MIRVNSGELGLVRFNRNANRSSWQSTKDYQQWMAPDRAIRNNRPPGFPWDEYSSPCFRSRSALKGPDDIRGDPAAVEFTRLRLHAFFIDVTGVHPARIESKMTTDCLETRRRTVVAPSRLRRQFIAHPQRPVGGHSLELAKGATCARCEQIRPYVRPRDVVHGGMAGFEHSDCTTGVRDQLSGKLHPEALCRCLNLRRARVVPNRFLIHRTSFIWAGRSGGKSCSLGRQ